MIKERKSSRGFNHLLRAALECFLADDYHRVSTRRIAERARVNVFMIRYYFGHKALLSCYWNRSCPQQELT